MNHHKTRHYMCFFAMLFTAASFAQSPSTLNPESEHLKLVASVSELAVDFEQTIYTALRKKSRSRSGRALFSKPDKFRWTFLSTNADQTQELEEFIFDGTKLSHFVKSEKTVTHYGVASGFATELRQVVNMVIDPAKLLESYSFDQTVTSDTAKTYQLSPKKPGEIVSLTVVILNKTSQVSSVAIQYQDGNRSTYVFKTAVGAKITPESFIFSNPGGIREKRVG